MKRATPLLLLLVLLFTACSTPDRSAGRTPDTRLTSIKLGTNATSSDEFTTQGIPFKGTQPAVTTLEVEIHSGTELLTFDASDDTYAFHPDGETTVISFGLEESVTVALPAGSTYTFKTRGSDTHGTWIAYGEATESVAVTTESVVLELKTLLTAIALDTSAPISMVVPDQVLDFYLAVTAPGGYPVPFDDYTVSYRLGAGDGQSIGDSSIGIRARSTATPADDFFTLAVEVTGWVDEDGLPVRKTLSQIFRRPFSVSAGFSLDADAPLVDLLHPGTPPAGATATINGTASDGIGLSRVQLYEGPLLIGSSDSSEYSIPGVARITFTGNAWSMPWLPETAGKCGLKAVAIDLSGNQSEDAIGVTVVEFSALDVEFKAGAWPTITVPVGTTLRLFGTTDDHYDPARFDIHDDYSDFEYIAHADAAVATTQGIPQIVVDGDKWSVEWTPTTVRSYYLHAWNTYVVINVVRDLR